MSRTATPNSSEPSTAASSTCPAVRTTNRSPRPWSKMISAATRLSPQPKTTAVGFWAAVRLARRSMLWLGCSGLPATKRSLPSLSAFHAVNGFVFGMADIVQEYLAVIDSHQLSRWYESARRDLPWRRPGVTPWQILVSEVMLQQTPVARVEPIWLQWVARWPTPSATAAAKAADVLRAWGKLGYPRRAKRLHECATVIAKQFDDEVPSDVETLLTLPGIGAYTARAVACFAYQRRVPVVDTNVRRVIARALHGRADAAASSSPRDLDDVAVLLPDDAEAPLFSVALMELGATVCTARAPACGVCPLSACVWRTRGYPAGTAVRRVQAYAGTDRQVRGRLLDVLRGNDSPVTRAQLDVAWLTDSAQRDRALDSLLVDGLVEQTGDGRYALAGEGDEARR
jgi:A/G-specific adenine glycosylase